MRLVRTIALIAPVLLVSACHSNTDTSAISNSVVDNTVGTASDEMTNIDATTGSAANMAADVAPGAQSGGDTSDSGDDSTPTGADAGSGGATPHASMAAPKNTHAATTAPKPTTTPKLDSNPGDTGN